MIFIKAFTFNPIQENTFLIYTDDKQGLIIDPGMYDKNEENEFDDYITNNNITLKYLVNTHCHIDHIMGNAYVSQKYGLSLSAHKQEEAILQLAQASAHKWNLNYTPSPSIENYLEPGKNLQLGSEQFEIRFVPGHSPGSIALYHQKQNVCIAGDALFKGSIGRTDLPMGNHNELLNSIKTQLFTLPDECIIYSGHGDQTTVGNEKKHNPFFN